MPLTQRSTNEIGLATEDTALDILAAIVSGVVTPRTPSAPTFATVGVASAQVVASNSSRKGLTLVNTSANTIYLGFGSPAVIGSGDVLYPHGVFEMDEYSFTTGAINAIASAASSNLTIQEYT